MPISSCILTGEETCKSFKGVPLSGRCIEFFRFVRDSERDGNLSRVINKAISKMNKHKLTFNEYKSEKLEDLIKSGKISDEQYGKFTIS